MAEYLALRVISGALDYCYVIGKKPLLKNDIDARLIEKDRSDLIRTDCPK